MRLGTYKMEGLETEWDTSTSGLSQWSQFQ